MKIDIESVDHVRIWPTESRILKKAGLDHLIREKLPCFDITLSKPQFNLSKETLDAIQSKISEIDSRINNLYKSSTTNKLNYWLDRKEIGEVFNLKNDLNIVLNDLQHPTRFNHADCTQNVIGLGFFLENPKTDWRENPYRGTYY